VFAYEIVCSSPTSSEYGTHIRQSRPDSGFGVQVNVLKPFKGVLFLIGSGLLQCATSWGTEICSGFEAGSYLRLIDFVYHSTLGLRVIKKKRESWGNHSRRIDASI